MRLADSTVSKVKAYPDIVSIVSEYVQLRRRGRNHIGLCPFHSEKTPSFTVSPEKHIFHCFGCHESGDLISFVQKIENLGFVEAIVYIAEKVGIEVEEDSASLTYDPESELRKKLRDILLIFKEKCQHYLAGSSEGVSYLRERKISEQSQKEFNLGYAPQSFNVSKEFEELGFSSEECLKAGVLFKSDNGDLISRFRNRLIFPVLDYQGRSVGFGGRILGSSQHGAKYVNSEETPLFYKRTLLYGLHLAKRGIKAHSFLLLVEGYMDVIMCHQYGFNNAVAAMGTSLTTEQAKKIKRFTDVVYMAMDSDEAGQAAMERAYEVLSQQGVTTYFVQLGAKDPADVLVESGKEAFQACLETAIPVVEFQFLRLCKRFDKNKIEQVSKIVSGIVDYIKQVQDPIIQRHYIQVFSRELNMDEELVMVKMNKTSYNTSKKMFQYERNTKTKIDLAEEYLLGFSALNVSDRAFIFSEVSIEDFKSEDLRVVAQVLKVSQVVGKDVLDLFEASSAKQLVGRLLIEMEEDSTLIKQKESQIRLCIDVIQSQKKSIRAEELKRKIQALERSGDSDEVSELLLELQEIKMKRGTMDG
jgi:DNA primase